MTSELFVGTSFEKVGHIPQSSILDIHKSRQVKISRDAADNSNEDSLPTLDKQDMEEQHLLQQAGLAVP